MTKTPQPECPECEKMREIAEKNNTQSIGLFLQFILPRSGYTLCKWIDPVEDENGFIDEGKYYSVTLSPERIIAECFGIDLDKVDDERRVLLEWIREQNETE